MKNYSRQISVHSAVATCEDQSRRLVTAFYQEDRCVVICRPWVSLLHKPVFDLQHSQIGNLLAFIISAADFEIVAGVWIGTLTTNCEALACITGETRNTTHNRLADLVRDGYIEYKPACGRVLPATIRIFPANFRTGLPLFSATQDWRLGFIDGVEPIMKLHEMAAPTVKGALFHLEVGR